MRFSFAKLVDVEKIGASEALSRIGQVRARIRVEISQCPKKKNVSKIDFDENARLMEVSEPQSPRIDLTRIGRPLTIVVIYVTTKSTSTAHVSTTVAYIESLERKQRENVKKRCVWARAGKVQGWTVWWPFYRTATERRVRKRIRHGRTTRLPAHT
ncbi:hypothetical protein EVAR_19376_1 [Eumeta japonica]|uniref:Uncharacterized protein n=1 Tax=Eumeta variegata TaxID=151549 RepID=A0A4C1TRG0_EUMVA|nr:hypothetical protein EVAR_19376_1 [Eumeta japonica]